MAFHQVKKGSLSHLSDLLTPIFRYTQRQCKICTVVPQEVIYQGPTSFQPSAPDLKENHDDLALMNSEGTISEICNLISLFIFTELHNRYFTIE